MPKYTRAGPDRGTRFIPSVPFPIPHSRSGGMTLARPWIRCLLLQLRDPDDPMRADEVSCFERVLSPLPVRISTFDLLAGLLQPKDLEGADFVFLGGSGAYSAATGGPWLERALESLRLVHASGVPAFASCWGFQGMAAAMGGSVVRDPSRAEVGTYELELTPAGQADPLFGYLGRSFKAQVGHEDLVKTLPPRTTPLASSAKGVNHAYRFNDAPIYCTQFHPELDAAGLFRRLATYPRYVEEVAGMTVEELAEEIEETPIAAELVPRFVRLHMKRKR